MCRSEPSGADADDGDLDLVDRPSVLGGRLEHVQQGRSGRRRVERERDVVGATRAGAKSGGVARKEGVKAAGATRAAAKAVGATRGGAKAAARASAGTAAKKSTVAAPASTAAGKRRPGPKPAAVSGKKKRA